MMLAVTQSAAVACMVQSYEYVQYNVKNAATVNVGLMQR